jgi:hypothetical protein
VCAGSARNPTPPDPPPHLFSLRHTPFGPKTAPLAHPTPWYCTLMEVPQEPTRFFRVLTNRISSVMIDEYHPHKNGTLMLLICSTGITPVLPFHVHRP